jgi:hypothetical protein
MSDADDALGALEPGDAPVFEPVDGATVTAHGLTEGSAGPVLFRVEVETDAGVLAAIETLELVDVDDDADRFVVTPERKPPARVHDRALEAVDALGGEVVAE